MTEQSFPFMNPEITKMFAQMKMPGIDVEVMMAAYRKNIEAMTAANQLCVEGMQTILRRNVDIMRSTMEELTALSQQAMAEGTPDEKLARQLESARAAFERNIANTKELLEIAQKANAEASDVLTARVTSGMEEMKEAVEAVGKN